MQEGRCKLCLEDKELCDSHYLPKRLYAFCRAKQMRNANPFVPQGRRGRQVADQLRGYVFCPGCEDLFSRNGEAWVLANIPRDYGAPFPLQDALGPEKPLAIGEDVNLYDGSAIKQFDMDKLVYFGASIFWRGAAHDWKSTLGLGPPKVDLGDHFESLRLFLLGKCAIPESVVLSVHLWPFTKVWQAAYPVYPLHGARWQRYRFYVPGILFMLHSGKNLPEEVRQRSAHGERKIIIVDLESGNFIRAFSKGQVQALERTDTMKAMLRDISMARSRISPKE